MIIIRIFILNQILRMQIVNIINFYKKLWINLRNQKARIRTHKTQNIQ